MPTGARSSIARDLSQVPAIPKELIRQFLTGSMTGEAINKATLVFRTSWPKYTAWRDPARRPE